MTDVQDPQRSGDSSGESHEQRIDRERMELLNELGGAARGAVPPRVPARGPVQQRSAELTDCQHDVYFATLLAAAVATGLLIAPAEGGADRVGDRVGVLVLPGAEHPPAPPLRFHPGVAPDPTARRRHLRPPRKGDLTCWA
jgi:hypothetical protein